MKELMFAMFFSLLLLSQTAVIADNNTDDIEDPGILPNSPFYGFKLFTEDVQMFFTFQEEARFRLMLQFAERRLSEANAIFAMNETEAIEALMERYQERIQNANETRERLRLQNITTDDIDNVFNRTVSNHVMVLERLMQNSSERVQTMLQNTLQYAEQNQEYIRNRLVEREQVRATSNDATGVSTTQRTQNTEMTSGSQEKGR